MLKYRSVQERQDLIEEIFRDLERILKNPIGNGVSINSNQNKGENLKYSENLNNFSKQSNMNAQSSFVSPFEVEKERRKQNYLDIIQELEVHKKSLEETIETLNNIIEAIHV